MPMYGVEDFVGKAIEGVLAQTYTDWELIAVNDGSPDRSAQIARAFEEKDSRIKVLDKTNGGLSDARNYGLKYANGEYIHFHDSDDWIEPHFYENLIRSININDNPDVIISGYTVDTINDKAEVKYLRKAIKWPQEDDANEIAEFISGYFNFAWNKLFKKDFLLLNNLEYEKGLKYIEDCEFMSRLVDFNPSISIVNNEEYHYVVDTRNTLSRQFNPDSIDVQAKRVVANNKIINFIIKDENIGLKVNELLKFGIWRFLLHSLFNNSKGYTISDKIKGIQQIVNYSSLSLLENSLNLNFKDKILWSIYKNKQTSIIFLIYIFFKKL